MIRFVARRLALAVSQVFAISVLAFTLLYLGAGDIARTIMGENATQEQVATRRQELGLDRPLPVRYGEWLANAVQGDFGRSYFTAQSVTEALATRLPVTLTLVIGVTIVSALLAFTLGIAAGYRRGAFDKVIQVLSVIGYAIPGFLVALLLVLVVSMRLGWLPATGYIPLSQSLTGWLSTIVLPIAALSVANIAAITQQVRSSVIDALRQDYVRTLRSRGLSERRVVLKHVLRNASGPGLTVMGLQFVSLLSIAIVVEQIFALPGLGTVAISYTSRGDVPVVLGLLLMTSVMVAVVNTIVDVVVGILNPKARVA